MALWEEEATSERIDGRNDNVDISNCCNHARTNSTSTSTSTSTNNNNTPTSTTTRPATDSSPPCRCFRYPGTGHRSPAQ
ncbi:hypothetical protein KCU97_g15243, partial [Aureobasidium melanogenum]